VPSRLLGLGEVATLAPGLALDGVLAGAFCSTDGRAVPTGAVDGFARAARRLGARLVEDVQVTGIEVAGGRVAAVETTAGRVATRLVVNAAGPWAAAVATLAGVQAPVFPKRFHQFVTGPVDGISPELPCILEPATTLFVAPEGAGVLLGMDRVEPSSTNTAVEWDFLPEVVGTAIRRFPAIESTDIRAAWAGLIELTPDGLPIVGQPPEADGLMLACGLNGHGFMLAPALGRAVSELICDGRYVTIDLGRFSSSRFAGGASGSVTPASATTA
jgi:sarcosine oxidase subunit beta